MSSTVLTSRPESEFERKYQAFLDTFYRDNGYQPDRINGKENRDGDLYLRRDDKSFLVEEKGLHEHKALAFEIIQDAALLPEAQAVEHGYLVPTNCLGNQFTTKAAVQIWYCEDKGIPYAVYQVGKTNLHKFYADNFGKYRPQPVTKGYGLTYCVFIPWDRLLQQGIAKQIWNAEDDLPF